MIAVILGAAAPIDAHRLDECLQAALIEITPDEVKVELNLNPGVQVADVMIWAIDRDHDGKISIREGDIYARRLITDLGATLDERPLKLELLKSSFDLIPELQSGVGNIRLEMRIRLRHLATGDHVLSFTNRHQPAISVYLVNALLPKSPSIKILKQERTDNQSIGRIYFSRTP